MAAVANLTLKNNADVNVIYYPLLVNTGLEAQYVDRTNGVLAGQSKAKLFFSENATTRKVSGKITFPVLNATTGLVSHTHLGKFEIACPLIGTATERLDIRKRLAAMIADAIVASAVDNGETPW